MIRIEDLSQETSLELIKYFTSYAAAVAQTRALVSVEDGLKRGLRQAIYANYKDGFTNKKSGVKADKILGSGITYYWHGPNALYDTIMRSGKSFITPYPLYRIDSSYGTLQKNNDHPAQRYSTLTLSAIADYLMAGYKEDGVKEWLPSFDGESEYPTYLPSLGYWNIVNGNLGIGVGLASSIPPFNLKELNEYLIKRIQGEEAEVPMPDFPIGGTIVNSNEVRKSLEKGLGDAIKMRANITYDPVEHSLIITELPYLVFSNTVHNQLLDLQYGKEKEKDEKEHINPGIVNIHDATGLSSKIEVFLEEGVSPEAMKELIYRETSAESYYSINLTMLVDGRYPKQMGFKEASDLYLQAQVATMKRIYGHKMRTLKNKVLVTKGLIKISDDIDHVIAIIKSSKNKTEAGEKLKQEYNFIDIQVKAILSFTLGNLTSLDLTALKDNLKHLESELEKVTEVYESEKLLKNEVVKKLREVSEKFGQERKTKLLNLGKGKDLIYITKDGRGTTVENKKRVIVGSVPIGSKYFGITDTGYIVTGTEAPGRLSKVFKLKKGEKIIGVGSEIDGKYICVLLENGNVSYIENKNHWEDRKFFTSHKPKMVVVSDSRLIKSSINKKQ